MDKKDVADALHALAGDDAARTAVAKIKEHWEDIDLALAAGVSRTMVYKTLTQLGLKMTKGSFLNALNKLKKDRYAPSQPRKITQNFADTVDHQQQHQTDPVDEYQGLSRKQRGLKVAEKYMNEDKISPHALHALEKERQRKQLLEKTDESSSD